MTITSSAFSQGGAIPILYTCKGKDISPPLQWDKVPGGTKSFVLICDDPDAPMGTWVHWVYYNIPGAIRELPEGVDTNVSPSSGGVQGITSFGRPGYGGPCPPSGTHRYFFKLYALDTAISPEKNAGIGGVRKLMEGHVLSKAELMGIFKK